MNTELPPIIDGCYFDLDHNMFKVRMVSYCGETMTEVLIEDIQGKVKLMDIKKWHKLQVFPFCYSGTEAVALSPKSA